MNNLKWFNIKLIKKNSKVKMMNNLSWYWLLLCINMLYLNGINCFCPISCSCDPISLHTDCHEARNMKMVPIFLNPQIKFLTLSQNQIKEISMSLQFYSELQLLDFSQNQIENLGRNNFENLRNLKVLNMSYNAIPTLESDAFHGLHELIVLDLSVNQIERIDQKGFRGLSRLEDLNLDRNRLESIDWDVFSEVLNLQRLTLRFNSLRILEAPSSYKNFIIFTLLNENVNNFKESKAIPNGENIWESSKSSNWPTQNGKRQEIEKVLPLTSFWQGNSSNISNQQPYWTLKNIIEVDLSWNQLALVKNYGLSPFFPSLNHLNLCCNYIQTVENEAFSSIIPKIEDTLALYESKAVPYQHQPISQLIQHSSPMKQAFNSSVSNNLTTLNLSRNRLNSIPTKAFVHLGNSLNELDLSSNRLNEQITKDSFASLKELQVLKISENTGIKFFHSNALKENVNLNTFIADHLTNVTEFPNLQIFNGKGLMKLISLQYCQIEKLPDEIFTNPNYSKFLPYLDITGNPIDCNCSAWKLFEYVQQFSTQKLAQSNEFKDHEKTKDEQFINRNHQNNGQEHFKSKFSSSKLGNVQCVSPSSLQLYKIKDLSSSDFLHCFPPKNLFPTENFELLVILLAGVIILVIIIIISVKLCCINKICKNSKGQNKTIENPSSTISNCEDKTKNMDKLTNPNCGTNTTLDDFCSRVGFGSVNTNIGSISTNSTTTESKQGILGNNNGGFGGGVEKDYYHVVVPPSPPITYKIPSKSKINGTFMRNGGYKETEGANHWNPPHPNSTLHHFHTSNPKTKNILGMKSRGGSSILLPPSYHNSMDSSSLQIEDDHVDEEPHHYMTITKRDDHIRNTLKNNKLRFNPNMQLVFSNEEVEEDHPYPNQAQFLQKHRQNSSAHPESHIVSPHPPNHPSILVHYEYDYSNNISNHNNRTSSSSKSHNPRMKQVPSVLV